MVTADLTLLRQREELLNARIATTQDPFLRENLISDLEKIVNQIHSLSTPAA